MSSTFFFWFLIGMAWFFQLADPSGLLDNTGVPEDQREAVYQVAAILNVAAACVLAGVRAIVRDVLAEKDSKDGV